ncbi:RmlC-like cupin [Hortaea werneckii]|nr:RmlC-like cupin [Hortaea werneckii]
MLPFTFAILACFATSLRFTAGQRLEVTTVPNHVRPYIVRAYSLPGVVVGTQIYRFPVTGPSSDNAFTLISTAAPASDELGVLPHAHYENFFCLRGRYNLWASRNGSNEGRVLSPGDYGAVPPNTTHTFQITDPLTEMVGVISPGGFEDLFYFLGSANVSSYTHSPYIPNSNATTPGGDASTISSLEKFDVHAKLDYSPPIQFDNNGTTDSTTAWHNGDNEPAENSSTPFFIAKDFGRKYLTGSAKTSYTIVQPFITATQSDGKFTEGTLTLSQGSNSTSQIWNLPGHTALEVIDGAIGVSVEGHVEKPELFVGDVVFIPANTSFSFWAVASFNKVLYIGQGDDTLDSRLIDQAKSWEAAVWPF